MGDFTNLLYKFFVYFMVFCVMGCQPALAIVPSNVHKVGDGNPGNKSIILNRGSNNPGFRWNESLGVLEQSVNGTDWVPVGSGSEGSSSGYNGLRDLNGDFESGTDDWNATGSSTLTLETTNPIEPDQSGIWDPGASGDTLDLPGADWVSIPLLFDGAKCQIIFPYRWSSGSKGNIEAVALSSPDDGSTVNELAVLDLESGSQTKTAQLFFDCPDPSTQEIRFRLRSDDSCDSCVADPDPITFDLAFYGTGRNTVQISQAEIYGTSLVPGTASCIWQSTNGSFGSFAADSDCPAYQTTGEVSEPGTKIPAIDVDSLRPAKYEISVNGIFDITGLTTDTVCQYRLSGSSIGTINGGKLSIARQGTQEPATAGNTLQGEFTVNDTINNETIEIEVVRAAGDGSCRIVSSDSEERELQWTLKKFPLSSAEAITLETVGQRATAQFTSPVSDDFTDGDTDEEITATDFGIEGDTQFFDVTCVNGEVASGNDCTGDQTYGVAFDVTQAGVYDLCTRFNTQSQLSDESQNNLVEYVLARVTAGTKTVLERSDYESSYRLTSPNGVTGNTLSRGSHGICQQFFLDTGRHEFKLLESATVGGASLRIQGPTASWSLELLSTQKPTPVFPEITEGLSERVSSAPSSSDLRIVSATIDGQSATINVDREDGAWIDSLVDSGTGNYEINITSGVFSSPPNCFGNPINSAEQIRVFGQDTSTILVDIVNDSGTSIDKDFHILCVGQK